MFFFGPENEGLSPFLSALNGHPILAVGDQPDFARDGAMIEIARRNRRLGFNINLGAARRSGLSIASPLLDLATVIEGRRP